MLTAGTPACRRATPTTVSVTAKDQFGNNLTAGGSTVTITKQSGTGAIGSVTDNGDGIVIHVERYDLDLTVADLGAGDPTAVVTVTLRRQHSARRAVACSTA